MTQIKHVWRKEWDGLLQAQRLTLSFWHSWYRSGGSHWAANMFCQVLFIRPGQVHNSVSDVSDKGGNAYWTPTMPTSYVLLGRKQPQRQRMPKGWLSHQSLLANIDWLKVLCKLMFSCLMVLACPNPAETWAVPVLMKLEAQKKSFYSLSKDDGGIWSLSPLFGTKWAPDVLLMFSLCLHMLST